MGSLYLGIMQHLISKFAFWPFVEMFEQLFIRGTKCNYKI